MRVDQEFMDAVDELRAMQKPIPTKAEVIRMAVIEVLTTRKAKAKTVQLNAQKHVRQR
jgi:hypothetical protein